MIYFFWNTAEKMHYQNLFEKLAENQELLNNNKDHSRKLGSPPFFHSNINLVLGHVLVDSVDKTHNLEQKFADKFPKLSKIGF